MSDISGSTGLYERTSNEAALAQVDAMLEQDAAAPEAVAPPEAATSPDPGTDLVAVRAALDKLHGLGRLTAADRDRMLDALVG